MKIFSTRFTLIVSIVIMVIISITRLGYTEINNIRPKNIKSVTLELKVFASSHMRVKVTGTTNLPEGMELLVSIEGRTNNFMGSDNVNVRNGRFDSEVFGSNKGLLPGQYVVEITSPMSIIQPNHVQNIIGENGKHLKGKVIKKRDGENVVEFKQPFQIAKDGSISLTEDRKAINAARNKTKKEVSSFLVALKKIEAKGRALETLRQNNTPACMKNIQNRKQEALALRANIEVANLPMEYSMPLEGAAIELSLCVTCSETLAPESCDRARVLIEEAEKALRDAH